MRYSIVVVTAGLNVLSQSRVLADRLAAEAKAQLHSMLGHDAGHEVAIRVIELRELAVDIAGKFANDTASPTLQRALQDVSSADAVVAVTPVFSASYSGLFKSFVDILDPKSLDGVPVALGATGGSARHALVVDIALRSLFSYLRAAQTPTGVFAAPEDREGGKGQLLMERIRHAGRELALLIAARPALGTELPELAPEYAQLLVDR
ncbi:NAD(P)H-dependent oxidoreductase [Acaricomes phytoseiuli]|uniref:CE1759 family FMN reductase n=1 Tax=Acaricomes phytoseiuli TaxID=291968 RepID=UPI0022227804|nr:CE1759 family FMN reductase [Acaricomes phytoseiuli]MCW1249959.1 NAD(P)H-dependent oxidoreductase [Acaricomes phytoseiuli]